jgi:hypothetical protein
MRSSQWQVTQIPVGQAGFLGAKKHRHAPEASFRRILPAATAMNRFRAASSRCRSPVVPTTRLESPTASLERTESPAPAPTAGARRRAETASRNAFSNGVTRRKSKTPKLLMARAAEPMLSGLRVRTRTIRGSRDWRDRSKRHSSYLSKERLATAPACLPGAGRGLIEHLPGAFRNLSRSIVHEVATTLHGGRNHDSFRAGRIATAVALGLDGIAAFAQEQSPCP